MSPPAREAWIEMSFSSFFAGFFPSPPAREAWIEIKLAYVYGADNKSPPAREAWIEIELAACGVYTASVASREGGVD